MTKTDDIRELTREIGGLSEKMSSVADAIADERNQRREFEKELRVHMTDQTACRTGVIQMRKDVDALQSGYKTMSVSVAWSKTKTWAICIGLAGAYTWLGYQHVLLLDMLKQLATLADKP